MESTKPNYKRVAINASEQEVETVHQIAKAKGHEITADYLRDLIERDAKSLGIDQVFNVQRGGRRQRQLA